jgi:hypothetical protein
MGRRGEVVAYERVGYIEEPESGVFFLVPLIGIGAKAAAARAAKDAAKPPEERKGLGKLFGKKKAAAPAAPEEQDPTKITKAAKGKAKKAEAARVVPTEVVNAAKSEGLIADIGTGTSVMLGATVGLLLGGSGRRIQSAAIGAGVGYLVASLVQ